MNCAIRKKIENWRLVSAKGTLLQRYNEGVALAQEYARQGKALIVAPDDTCGVDTLKKDKESLRRLYEKGYSDGKKITDYLIAER